MLILALPPVNRWALSFAALVPFFLLIRSPALSTRRLFWVGTGIGALYWAGLYHMFFVNVPYPWLQIAPWLIWILAILIFLILALLAGLTWGVYPIFARRVLAKKLRWPYLWLAAGWVALEIARTFLFWNISWGMTIGYSLPPAGVFGQLASLGSVFIIGFGLVVINWFLTDLVTTLRQSQSLAFRPLIPNLTKLALLLAVWVGSGLILGNWLAGQTAKSRVVRGVALQTSIVSKNEWLDGFRYDQLLFKAQAVQSEDSSQDRLIVLPEVSYGIDPSNSQQMTSRPSQFIYPDLGTFQTASVQKIAPNTTLVAGFVDTTDPAAWRNGAGIVSRDTGSSLAYKRRLFPFGEYLPLASLWPAAVRDFYRYAVPATNHDLAKTPVGSISVIFCNELFMPSLAARDAATGADVITILSSNFDVGTPWYALWQQRAAAYRAVETRRSVILAADQAQAAVIAPSGKILAEVAYKKDGFAAADIPLVTAKSPWVSLQLIWKILAAIAVGILIWGMSRREAKL